MSLFVIISALLLAHYRPVSALNGYVAAIQFYERKFNDGQFTDDFGLFPWTVEGERVTALFEDVVAYNKFKNNTDTILEYTLTDGTNSHTYLFPKVKYVKGMITGSGAGPLVVELDFTAVYDTTAGSTVQVTRV